LVWLRSNNRFQPTRFGRLTGVSECLRPLACDGARLARRSLAPERAPPQADQKLGSDARRAMRQAKSKPTLEDIRVYLEREQPQVLPKSPEGQAIAYTLSNWKALIRYCEDGDLEIDNNGTERSLRGVAVGRKNWMFLGATTGDRQRPC
jgi:hypothetical protein